MINYYDQNIQYKNPKFNSKFYLSNIFHNNLINKK